MVNTCDLLLADEFWDSCSTSSSLERPPHGDLATSAFLSNLHPARILRSGHRPGAFRGGPLKAGPPVGFVESPDPVSDSQRIEIPDTQQRAGPP